MCVVIGGVRGVVAILIGVGVGVGGGVADGHGVAGVVVCGCCL